MDLGTVLIILLVLACPITMFWMMRSRRGMHDHGNNDPRSPTPVTNERLTPPDETQRAAERALDAPGERDVDGTGLK